ncbi:MAG: hypothetical protein QOI34_1421 [Verrucomicrobiota bacterium]
MAPQLAPNSGFVSARELVTVERDGAIYDH